MLHYRLCQRNLQTVSALVRMNFCQIGLSSIRLFQTTIYCPFFLGLFRILSKTNLFWVNIAKFVHIVILWVYEQVTFILPSFFNSVFELFYRHLTGLFRSQNSFSALEPKVYIYNFFALYEYNLFIIPIYYILL